jgi:flagellar biosynthesis anti-sigma factor FlgM
MTINLLGKPLQSSPLPSKSAHNEKAQGTDKNELQKAEAPVNVDITDIAQKITEAFRSSLKEAPAIDEERVAATKQAVLDGTYTINAEVIAEKMMAMEQYFNKPDPG